MVSAFKMFQHFPTASLNITKAVYRAGRTDLDLDVTDNTHSGHLASGVLKEDSKAINKSNNDSKTHP